MRRYLKKSVVHRRSSTVAACVVASVIVAACGELTPTAIGGSALPGVPVTVEVLIPWSQFASDLEVFGGYGTTEDVGHGLVANAFAGVLDASTLLRFGGYPSSATVVDSAGASRPDTNLTYIGGRLVVFFDSIAHTNSGPVTIGLGATEEAWDAPTADWDNAFDTINDQRAWTQPGGGAVIDLGTAVWDPAAGDSVVFPLDSAQIDLWSDSTDVTRGALIQLTDAGERAQLRSFVLRVDARPSLDPDTVVVVSAIISDVTFIYSPEAAPPTNGIRIGGAPAWRTVLDITIPEELNGPPEFCAVVSCPHPLTAVQVSSAALVLTSSASEAAFQPSDSIRLDIRSVFDRSAMPKAPLGSSLLSDPSGRSLAPEAFGTGAGLQLEIPFTSLARDLINGVDGSGNPAPNTLALLTILEPSSISFASFVGTGGAGEPFLRLVLTIGPSVQLP
jgi:hypothetical protein